jgi:hypothetical protein
MSAGDFFMPIGPGTRLQWLPLWLKNIYFYSKEFVFSADYTHFPKKLEGLRKTYSLFPTLNFYHKATDNHQDGGLSVSERRDGPKSYEQLAHTVVRENHHGTSYQQ